MLLDAIVSILLALAGLIWGTSNAREMPNGFWIMGACIGWLLGDGISELVKTL